MALSPLFAQFQDNRLRGENETRGFCNACASPAAVKNTLDGRGERTHPDFVLPQDHKHRISFHSLIIIFYSVLYDLCLLLHFFNIFVSS